MMIYQFPFQKVQPGSHIYIWGVGIVGREYIKQIAATKYCEIDGIIDTYSELKEYQGYLF